MSGAKKLSDELLIIEQIEHVQLLTLNRPDRHHALNYSLANLIAKAVDTAESDDNVRAIVITGNGERAFCAGQDMLEMSGIESSAGDVAPAPTSSKSSSAAIAVERVAAAKIPVIAAINGICYGGGALLALACDIRIANGLSTYRFPGAEYGLVVGAASLPRLVGTSKAKELIYTARKFAAQEALDCGLLSHVYETEEVVSKALELGHQIARNSPVAVRESKRVIDAATLVAHAEQLEGEINQRLRGSAEQKARFNEATTRVTGKKP